MIITTDSSSTFTPCPAGAYLARCCSVIDMGTQQTDFNGETKHQRKVLISFEILDPDTHRDDGKPYLISKRYTASLHEKASLRRDLEAWRGAKFADAEVQRFDLGAIVGRTCLLSVIHDTKPDGKTFANIAGISKPPKGMTGSEPTEPLLHFDLAAPNWPLFDTLGEKLKAQIAASPEYSAARATKATPPGATAFDDMPDDAAF